jgi:hypothetical protein
MKAFGETITGILKQLQISIYSDREKHLSGEDVN